MALQSFGVIGLAVMGENLALNVERNGFPISVYNRSREKTDAFMANRAGGKNVVATYSLQDFVASLERPRKILMMVQAGKPVDAVIEQLKPFLEEGDILIDGGNSLYEDTERRTRELEPLGYRFIGMGVSGGEEGALNGPSLMPGGTKSSYEYLSPIFAKIAAQVDDGPCVTYIGPGGAGHYVKMVHNGIEYGDMQLIAEAYDLLKNAAGLNRQQLHEVFAEWNLTDELNSFLIEITADIFKYIDPETNQPLVELILDAAGQKGTGRWTIQTALDLGVAIPTMTAAVNARIMSSAKQERVYASRLLTGPSVKFQGDVKTFVNQVRDAPVNDDAGVEQQEVVRLVARGEAHVRDDQREILLVAAHGEDHADVAEAEENRETQEPAGFLVGEDEQLRVVHHRGDDGAEREAECRRRERAQGEALEHFVHGDEETAEAKADGQAHAAREARPVTQPGPGHQPR